MGRRKASSPENHERWLVSYADFITLLFAFFVVMFATSQSDKGKASAVSESVKAALEESKVSNAVTKLMGNAPAPKKISREQPAKPASAKEAQLVELLPSLNVLSRELKEEIKAGKIQLGMGPRGLTISFMQAALFPSGQDDIDPGAYPSVAKIAEALNKVPNPVRLEGHTDSVPIHNARFRDNWDLSASRSIALLRLLHDQYGVSETRVSVGGYADVAPVASNETEEGRARNRRVDMTILNATGVQGEPTRAAKPSR